MSSKWRTLRIGLAIAALGWVGAFLAVFLVLSSGSDPNVPDKGVPTVVAAGATIALPAWILLRYFRSNAKQERSNLHVRNPFRSFVFDLAEAKGYIDIERPGGSYTAFVLEDDRRLVRVIGLAFPPSGGGVDLGELPFIEITKRRSYW
jgi:hypothetical protein